MEGAGEALLTEVAPEASDALSALAEAEERLRARCAACEVTYVGVGEGIHLQGRCATAEHAALAAAPPAAAARQVLLARVLCIGARYSPSASFVWTYLVQHPVRRARCPVRPRQATHHDLSSHVHVRTAHVPVGVLCVCLNKTQILPVHRCVERT